MRHKKKTKIQWMRSELKYEVKVGTKENVMSSFTVGGMEKEIKGEGVINVMSWGILHLLV